LEHGMQALAQPVKLWSMGPFFRHERPQAGRYRQFSQVDAEVIGSDSPLVDAEVIILLDELLKGLGVPALRLKLSSIGTAASRSGYREELVAFLRSHEAELAPDVRDRIDENPLRAFDSKDEGTRQVMEKAPTMLERLEGEDAGHFDEVRALLDQAGVNYGLDSTLVRGLDYYTRTVFAFESKNLGAQSEVGGGGRYDGLVELLGGPPTPGVGWAAGVERIVMALGAEEPEPTVSVFIAAPPSQSRRALTLASDLRRSGISADLDLAGRALKGQMKHADRLGARHAVILDEDGSAQLRDMTSGEQREVTLESLVAEFSGG